MTYKDGRVYVGEFKDDKMEGKGIYIWENGDKYVGEWRDNQMAGFGKKTDNNGDVYVGEFKDDKITLQSATAKKQNQIQTLLIRSNEMNNEKLS